MAKYTNSMIAAMKEKLSNSLTHYSWSIALIAVACVGIFLGTIMPTSNNNQAQKDRERYPYLATRLFGALHDDMIINFTQLREVMNQRYLDRELPLGVYFEYLPTGASIGVNDQLQVEIGSLSKVPAVMAIYKQLELGTLRLNDSLTVEKKNLDNRFGDLWQRGEGTKLSVEEAISYTLRKSDNTAASTLTSALPEGELQAVFDDLDLPRTRTGPFPVMSPKSYSSVFRNLFLSAYLSQESSNAILDHLTRTDYADKLPAGVPSSVSVAHKIGVFRVADTQDIYSDCGIVYVPSRPYVLCVMVAADEETAREEISAYSKMVYSFVSQVKASRKLSQ